MKNKKMPSGKSSGLDPSGHVHILDKIQDGRQRGPSPRIAYMETRFIIPDDCAHLPVEPAPKMNKFERDVIRRKKPILADVLDFSEHSQRQYRALGLLTDDMLAEITPEVTDYGRTFKWIDLMCSLKKDAWRHLEEMLTARGFSWVAHELQADLLAERGDIELEEYVFREAGQYVHKHFGGSKRVAEVDKKIIQTMIATRYQAAKEAWRRQMVEEKRTKEKALSIMRHENGRLKRLGEKIRAFMRVQKPRLSTYADDLESALELTRDDPDPDSTQRDYFLLSEKAVDETLELMTTLVIDKETRDEERKRCLELLQCELVTVEMDIVLGEALRRERERATHHQHEATVSDKLATSLDQRLKRTQREMERDLAEKERHIVYLESVARQRESTIRAMERQNIEAKVRIEDLETELLSWQKRCGLVEKTRRLGYYFPGWYDKMYANVTGTEYDRKNKKSPLSKSDDAITLRRAASKSSNAGTASRPATTRGSHASSSSRSLPSARGTPKIIRRSYTQLPLRLDNQQQTSPTVSPQQSMAWNSGSHVGLTNGHVILSTPPPPIPPEQEAVGENGGDSGIGVNWEENSAAEDENTQP